MKTDVPEKGGAEQGGSTVFQNQNHLLGCYELMIIVMFAGGDDVFHPMIVKDLIYFDDEDFYGMVR